MKRTKVSRQPVTTLYTIRSVKDQAKFKQKQYKLAASC